MSEDFLEVICTTLCPTLSRAQAGALLALTEPVGIAVGEILFREGETGKGLFFFVAGQVEIVQQRRDGSPQSVAIIKAPKSSPASSRRSSPSGPSDPKKILTE
ncbi:MAG TPA: cyclic nucleotide-binding domain-containing protein [Methylomirabilota bacterium]|jgi:CRP-like cAMP-binding protein|nr:cyclic nucleotide-binding domain-containing protein [Methylomirabilota bacterium]